MVSCDSPEEPQVRFLLPTFFCFASVFSFCDGVDFGPWRRAQAPSTSPLTPRCGFPVPKSRWFDSSYRHTFVLLSVLPFCDARVGGSAARTAGKALAGVHSCGLVVPMSRWFDPACRHLVSQLSFYCAAPPIDSLRSTRCTHQQLKPSPFAFNVSESFYQTSVTPSHLGPASRSSALLSKSVKRLHDTSFAI